MPAPGDSVRIPDPRPTERFGDRRNGGSAPGAPSSRNRRRDVNRTPRRYADRSTRSRRPRCRVCSIRQMPGARPRGAARAPAQPDASTRWPDADRAAGSRAAGAASPWAPAARTDAGRPQGPGGLSAPGSHRRSGRPRPFSSAVRNCVESASRSSGSVPRNRRHGRPDSACGRTHYAMTGRIGAGRNRSPARPRRRRPPCSAQDREY